MRQVQYLRLVSIRARLAKGVRTALMEWAVDDVDGESDHGASGVIRPSNL